MVEGRAHAGVAGRALTAAAAVLVVVALLGGIVLATGVLRADPPPADRPDRHDPIEIEGIAGDGGLRIEKDLAIGRASVAIANDTGAFVVTADDGVSHRIALPGFDAPLYARTAAERASTLPEMLSLSPDGTKLIYAWHEPFVPPPATDRGQVREPGEGWVAERCPAAGPDHRCHRHLPVRPDDDRSYRPSWAGSTGTSGGRPTAGSWRSTRRAGHAWAGRSRRHGADACSTPRRR